MIELIKKIKANKKYKSLSDSIVKKELKDYIKKNPDYKDYKEKKIISDIRKVLHKSYARFQIKKKKKREKFLKEKNVEGILKTNLSTKERQGYYSDVYSRIFKITGDPKIILDLGCGLNPCSYTLMDTSAKYYAYDIDDEDIKFLNKFFKIYGINGKAEILDISEIEKIRKLPKADVCFLFKVLDVLEKGKGHKLSEEIIKAVKCDFVIVSFATKTISGKNMKYGPRGWIKRMLERIGYKYEVIKTRNEDYYIIKK